MTKSNQDLTAGELKYLKEVYNIVPNSDLRETTAGKYLLRFFVFFGRQQGDMPDADMKGVYKYAVENCKKLRIGKLKNFAAYGGPGRVVRGLVVALGDSMSLLLGPTWEAYIKKTPEGSNFDLAFVSIRRDQKLRDAPTGALLYNNQRIIYFVEEVAELGPDIRNWGGAQRFAHLASHCLDMQNNHRPRMAIDPPLHRILFGVTDGLDEKITRRVFRTRLRKTT